MCQKSQHHFNIFRVERPALFNLRSLNIILYPNSPNCIWTNIFNSLGAGEGQYSSFQVFILAMHPNHSGAFLTSYSQTLSQETSVARARTDSGEIGRLQWAVKGSLAGKGQPKTYSVRGEKESAKSAVHVWEPHKHVSESWFCHLLCNPPCIT